MDEAEIKKLISNFKEVYNNPNPEIDVKYLKSRFVDPFIGDEKGEIARLIYDFIDRRNTKPSTFIFSIDNFIEKEILRHINTRPL